MSLTIRDCLKLPSMSRSRVIAGNSGLDQIVASISVAEFFEYEDDGYDVFTPNELVITAFHFIKDDPEAQVTAIRELQHTGSVALILFYLGTVVKKLHPDILRLADQLGFPIIVVDSDVYDLKYSDVLSDVFAAIFRDQQKAEDFAAAVRLRLAQFPVHQRTMERLLNMISGHYKCNLFLEDRSLLYFESVYRPAAGIFDLGRLRSTFRDSGEGYASTVTEIDGSPAFLCKLNFLYAGEVPMTMYASCSNTALDQDIMQDICECAEAYTTLWGYSLDLHSARTLLSLMLKADSSVAEKYMEKVGFRFDKELMLLAADPGGADHQALAGGLEALLRENGKWFLMDHIDSRVVLLVSLDRARAADLALTEDIRRLVEEADGRSTLFWGGRVRTIREVRERYSAYIQSADALKKIFVYRRTADIHDILLCQDVLSLARTDTERSRHLQAIIDCLQADRDDLLQTLAVYMIDCDSKVNDTAGILFLHRNTVAYRLNKAKLLTDTDFTLMPAFNDFYTAAALWRLQQAE